MAELANFSHGKRITHQRRAGFGNAQQNGRKSRSGYVMRDEHAADV
jgi:hypothetical protein